MSTGIVTSWADNNGLIRPDDGGPLVMLSASSLSRSDRERMSVGARVRYVGMVFSTHVVARNPRLIREPFRATKFCQVAEIK